MANLNLFASIRGAFTPPATSANEAGGLAYQRSAEQALALYAATGCLNGTYYAGGEEQLAQALLLAAQVEPVFVAKTAVHARRVSHMKDMPALLLASLSLRDGELFAKAFGHVVDSGRMLRNVVQILRSGRVGRKSLGSRPKRLVREWIQAASSDVLINAAVGNQPSLADLIRMVHPKPANAEREALYAWIVGRPYAEAALPAKLQGYEAFKREAGAEVPDMPFLYFTSLPLSAAHWQSIARNASWQTLRMNLNHFGRHGVFEDQGLLHELVAKLTDAAAIAKARVFPYQLLMAYRAGADLPDAIRGALHEAMEVATRQVPVIAGKLVVAVDVSGSMASPVTGHRKGATSAVRCVDAAALFAASLLRSNPQARVLPFDTQVRSLRLEPRDTVMTQATQLAALCGGGTSVSAPLVQLNREQAQVDLLVLVSDNESWRDTRAGGATETMRQWAQIKARCPQAKLVCIDLQPVATSQAVEREDVLHVGGFSDAVFEVVAAFAAGAGDAARWQQRIAQVEL
jgi:60 kDa SS-A/Ro ribonucleoprotein